MFHRNILSVTLAPQNTALSARNVGTDTADRTVPTHHLDIQFAFEVKLDLALNFTLLRREQASLDVKPQPPRPLWCFQGV